MKAKDVFYIILSALIWSTGEVSLKVAGQDLDPFQLTFLRFLLGGAMLIPFMLVDLKKREVRLNRQDWLYLFLTGTLNISVSMVFFQLAIQLMNAGLVAMIFSCNAVFTMVFAHFIVNDRFTAGKAVVLAISLTGLFIIADPLHMKAGVSIPGLICALLAAVTFGLYTAFGKLRIERLGGLTETCLGCLLGTVGLLGFLLITHRPLFAGIHVESLPVLAYVCIVVSGLAYFSYFKAIEGTGPANASLVFFLKPMLAPIFAFFALSEPISPNMIIGLVIITVGFLLNFRRDIWEARLFPRHR